MIDRRKTYRLGSNEMVYAPGVVAWAINGYQFKRDREAMIEVLTKGWNLPRTVAIQLLSKKIEYHLEDDVVVISY